VPATQIASAFGARLAARGAVPAVRVATLAEAPVAASSSSTRRPAPTPTTQAVARAERAVSRRAGAGLRPPAPRPVRSSPTFEVELPVAVTETLELPPFPEIDDETQIEDALLRLKQRLDLLYLSVAPARERAVERAKESGP